MCRIHERRDLALVEPGRVHDRSPALAHQVQRQAAETVTGWHCLAAPTDHQEQRPAPEPATQVGDRVDRGLIRGVDVVKQDKSGPGPFTGRADHRCHALQQAYLGTGAVERERIGYVLPQLSQVGQEQ